MAKRCDCGHGKGDHNRPGGVCDYAGYACGCTGHGKPVDPKLAAKIRKALGL